MDASGHIIIVKKGGDASHAPHAPDSETVAALRTLCSIKREVTGHPEAPPERIMRGLQEAPRQLVLLRQLFNFFRTNWHFCLGTFGLTLLS